MLSPTHTEHKRFRAQRIIRTRTGGDTGTGRAMPVFHLVFLKFKPEHCTEAVTTAGHLAAQGLLLRIPGVTSARFGKTFNGARADGFTHSLCVVLLFVFNAAK